jgi:hypothetical protein
VAASYPLNVKTNFSSKIDFTTTVIAQHVIDLDQEVTAIETALGTYPTLSAGWTGTFSFGTEWQTLRDRIQNIEYGIGYVWHDYVDVKGGSTVTTETAATVGVVWKGATSQTADLTQWQTSSGTTVSKVDAAGEIYTSGKKVVPIVYASTQPSSVPAGTIWVDSSSTPSIQSATSGVPSGGTTGQALIKASNTDYNTTWGTINAASALTGTTMASNVVSSSLTSVGTLTSLAVTGTATAGTFSGSGASLTNIPTSAIPAYVHPFLLGGM